MFENYKVVIKGAGDLATGVAVRLWNAGFPVILTELVEPMAIRRTVAFSDAIFSGEMTVEGVTARKISTIDHIQSVFNDGKIPIFSDPETRILKDLKPSVFIDATLAKRNLGTHITDAPFVIALGPGFTAGVDAHVVIETNRGHYLGRIIHEGQAEPDTGIPGEIKGISAQRVIFSPTDGVFTHHRQIGDLVQEGDLLGMVGETAVFSPLGGILRGLIHDGIFVKAKTKIGDVDPRAKLDHCFTISEKAFAIGGGVLEAILVWIRKQNQLLT